MKDFTFLLILSISISFSNILPAQNPIPNNDFENWSGNTPVDWDSSNESILGIDFTCVTRETNDPQNGQYSAKVQSVSHDIIFVGTVTMPGILTLGNVIIDIVNQTGTVVGGVPVDGYPKFLKGYFKYQPALGDSCIIGIGLTRWNGTNTDTIAYSYTKFGSNITNWQEFTLPVQYETFVEPDTMNIMFISSNIETGVVTGGSTLWVDNLWIEFSQVAVNDLGVNKRVYVYETADGNFITLNTREQILKADLYNINGFLLKTINATINYNPNIRISDLPSGIYLLRVLFPDGGSKTVKFRRI
ncbi:MAG TPA: PCMD domain-containing protein [Lentimicrobium sp.]|nr:PCMD domain-containing protein [Lentimicrobium sp.]